MSGSLTYYVIIVNFSILHNPDGPLSKKLSLKTIKWATDKVASTIKLSHVMAYVEHLY